MVHLTSCLCCSADSRPFEVSQGWSLFDSWCSPCPSSKLFWNPSFQFCRMARALKLNIVHWECMQETSGLYFFGGTGRTLDSSALSYDLKLSRELWITSCQIFQESLSAQPWFTNPNPVMYLDTNLRRLYCNKFSNFLFWYYFSW